MTDLGLSPTPRAFALFAVVVEVPLPQRAVPRRSLSVCSHVVIRRVVETGSFLGLSTTKESRRLHSGLWACLAGVPRGVVPDMEKANAVLASAYRNQ